MAFEWNDSLSVGVNMIDTQHKELIARVNSLMEAMKHGKGREEIDRIVAFVESYVGMHFAEEEQLMVWSRYPDYPAHRALHAAFVNDFVKMKSELDAAGGSLLPVLQIQRRVCDWTINHIGKTDRLLGEFLKDAD